MALVPLINLKALHSQIKLPQLHNNKVGVFFFGHRSSLLTLGIDDVSIAAPIVSGESLPFVRP